MNPSEISALFGEPQKCYGHCDQPASIRFLKEEDGMVIAAMVCHAGYVSRVMAYGRELDLGLLKSFISQSWGGGKTLGDEDLRVATRFAWDLGMEGRGEDVVVRVGYWTQNYRGSKSDDPNRLGLFSCANCSCLFPQPVNSKAVLCTACRGQV